MLQEGLAILFITALFALDAFVLEAQAEKVAVVLVFEGAQGGLRRLGGEQFVVREVGNIRLDSKGFLL